MISHIFFAFSYAHWYQSHHTLSRGLHYMVLIFIYFHITPYSDSVISILILHNIKFISHSMLYFVKLNDHDLLWFHRTGQYNEVWGRGIIYPRFHRVTSLCFTEWSMGEGVLYTLLFTESRHCVSQNSGEMGDKTLQRFRNIVPEQMSLVKNSHFLRCRVLYIQRQSHMKTLNSYIHLTVPLCHYQSLFTISIHAFVTFRHLQSTVIKTSLLNSNRLRTKYDWLLRTFSMEIIWITLFLNRPICYVQS